MSSIDIPSHQVLERVLSLEIVRVTERAAVNAARLRGRGDEKAADQAAVDAMRRELNKLPIDGTVVIGEGEMDEAPMLFIGEKVGGKGGFKVDIAVDPLEGTTLCAKNMPGAIATLADLTVMAAAWCGVDAPPQLRGVTVSMALDFMAPARATDVIGVGRVLRRGRSLVNCEAEIVDPEGRLVAKALASYKVG